MEMYPRLVSLSSENRNGFAIKCASRPSSQTMAKVFFDYFRKKRETRRKKRKTSAYNKVNTPEKNEPENGKTNIFSTFFRKKRKPRRKKRKTSAYNKVNTPEKANPNHTETGEKT